MIASIKPEHVGNGLTSDGSEPEFFAFSNQSKGLIAHLDFPSQPSPWCPSHHWPILRGEQIPSPALALSVYKTGKLHDVVDGTYGTLGSPKFFAALEAAGLTGWSSLPITLTDLPADHPLATYRVLTVRGRCGPRDVAKSPRVTLPPAVPKGRPYKSNIGFFFDPQSWDGSDFFCPGETALVLLTAKARQVLMAAKFVNVSLSSTRSGEFPIW